MMESCSPANGGCVDSPFDGHNTQLPQFKNDVIDPEYDNEYYYNYYLGTGSDGIGATIFPLWQDLYISSGSVMGIYYQIDGPVGARNLTIE